MISRKTVALTGSAAGVLALAGVVTGLVLTGGSTPPAHTVKQQPAAAIVSDTATTTDPTTTTSTTTSAPVTSPAASTVDTMSKQPASSSSPAEAPIPINTPIPVTSTPPDGVLRPPTNLPPISPESTAPEIHHPPGLGPSASATS